MFLTFQVWRCIPELVKWQTEERGKLTHTTSAAVHAGINYSILLMSACYLEGTFEEGLLKLAERTTSDQPLTERLLSELRTRISLTTGSEGYNGLFSLVLGRKATEILNDNSLWETVKVLFHLRNMIAHGRAVKYTLYMPPHVGGLWADEFSGGYKKIEDYLISKGFLEERHIESGDNWLFFTDEVADHFWEAVQKFIRKLGDNLSDGDQIIFRKATTTLSS